MTTDSRLAIDGGPPACPQPVPAWPPADASIREALVAAFDEGTWGKYDGPHVPRLIEILSDLHKVPFVHPCCSGTMAVELALRGLRVEPGQEVILAGYDFPGNFRAIEAVGAVPVLVDIVPGTWCLDVNQVESAISARTRAVVVSHLHGGMADMRQLKSVTERRGLAVVEDACQAPGAQVHGRLAGTWGDVGVWSFGGSKLLTAGRGGAVFTSDTSIWQRIKVFCERGNHAFPLSELQAAVLIPQLARLAELNERRRRSVARLLQRLSLVEGLSPLAAPPADCAPSYYKVAWRYSAPAGGDWPRERFVAAVRAEGAAIDVGFRGFLRRSSRSRRIGTLEHSAAAAETTILLHHPILLEAEEALASLAKAVQKVAAAARNRVHHQGSAEE